MFLFFLLFNKGGKKGRGGNKGRGNQGGGTSKAKQSDGLNGIVENGGTTVLFINE